MAPGKDLWRRVFSGPALFPQPDTWLEEAATTPDLLPWQNLVLLFVGGVRNGHERIVLIRLPKHRLGDANALANYPTALVVDVGSPGDFDGEHITDPASVEVNGKIFLYYSALGAGPDCVGLAISSDGVVFEKWDRPVLIGRAPEVVWAKGCFYLFYVLETSSGGYAVHLATSADGHHFAPVSEAPVFAPDTPGAWDGYSVTTPRIFEHRGVFYMVYAGDNRTKDLPRAFGLARSHDLQHWDRYPGNPIFRCGPPGAWDDGAIWFGTVFPHKGMLYLWYEGASRQAIQREGPVLSQVGLAVLPVGEFETLVRGW